MSSLGCAVGLYNPRNQFNVGSVLRAAQCFNANLVVLQGKRYQRAGTDTMNGYKSVPLVHTEDLFSSIPYRWTPIAVEIVNFESTSLPKFKHPNSAFYIFGPEDGSLPKEVLDKCKEVVSIPSGVLNLAAAVNIILYDRMRSFDV
jgi:tRNA(Leu) C34 or U34 (ribose-2'-O)-methylase TrmL